MLAAIINMENNLEQLRKAVFFDRDGTLNVEKHYLYKPEDFQWMPEAMEAIQHCHDKGYLAVVITNQSGVARGYYTEADILRLHQWMNQDLQEHGVAPIDGFYYCPHHPQAKVQKYAVECSCRKPKPGLILQACQELDINPAESVMIGDKPRDVECGEAAGTKGVLYEGGSLLELVEALLK